MLGTYWSGYLGSTEHTETPGCGTPMATCCSRPRSTPRLALVLERCSIDIVIVVVYFIVNLFSLGLIGKLNFR